MDEMFKGIKAAISFLFPTYDTTRIFQAYNNNMVLPSDGNYIIMTSLDRHAMGLTPVTFYDVPTETQQFGSNDSTNFQVDFYGDNVANLAATFRLFLTTINCSELLYSEHACSVHTVEIERNLTMDLDQDRYLPRYVVRFSLFNNNNASIPVPGIPGVDVGVILAEVQA
jgi:hypothetical protein